MSSSPSPYFVDLGEELVGGVAREHVRGARLDPDSDECQLATLLPCPRATHRRWGRRTRDRPRSGRRQRASLGSARRPRPGSTRRARATEAVVVELGDESGGSGGIVVGKRAMLEERAALRDGGEGGADATRSDDESSHGAWLYTEHLVRRIAHGGARLPSISPIGGRT